MRSTSLAVGLFLLLTSLTGQAEQGSCRNGHFPASEVRFSIAEVSGAREGRSHFFDDGEGCPEGAHCRRKSYLVDGDQILIAQRNGDWSCVWYAGQKTNGARRVGARREFVGWMDSADLRRLPVKQASAQDWIGEWHFYDNRLLISAGNEDALEVSGEAVWYGGINSYGEPVVHVGSLAGAGLVTDGNLLRVREGEDEYSCQARLRLVGSSLVVDDNGNCGGMNVRFNGVYWR